MNLNLLEKFMNAKVLVVGDYCIDKFCYGEPKGISPEAPILRIVGNKDTIKINPGMAGNIAAGVRALGAECYAVGVVGEDESSRNLVRIFKERGINTQGMISRNYRVTPEFMRVVAVGKSYPEQQEIRFDTENTEKTGESATREIINFISELKGLDAVIVADYNEFGEGIVNSELLDGITTVTKKQGILLMGDSRLGFGNFRDFTCIKPNFSEAEHLYSGKAESVDDLAWRITQRLNLESVLITRDKDGMYLLTNSGIKKEFPAYAKKVVDVTGAGDSVISAFTTALASGFSYEDSAQLASYAAAVSVSKPGVAAVSLDELKQFALENEK
ncbi:MAG TPA: bifunctional ADP-heptose synthase [Patescibacteria group bacterium]|nr:bifunctional ADP-heptose synthase [Patescibacteria group bacterium]